MDIEKRPGLVRAGAYVIVDMEDRKAGLNGIAGKILFLYRRMARAFSMSICGTSWATVTFRRERRLASVMTRKALQSAG